MGGGNITDTVGDNMGGGNFADSAGDYMGGGIISDNSRDTMGGGNGFVEAYGASMYGGAFKDSSGDVLGGGILTVGTVSAAHYGGVGTNQFDLAGRANQVGLDGTNNTAAGTNAVLAALGATNTLLQIQIKAATNGYVAGMLTGTLPNAVLPQYTVTNGSATIITNSGGLTLTGGQFTGNGVNVTNSPPSAIFTVTNTSGVNGVINFTNAEGTLYTNASFTFQAAVVANPSAYQDFLLEITNSSGSLISISGAPGWFTNGTWNCTNISQLFLHEHVGMFTNAFMQPLK
jgi:hypothetical protein